MNDEHTNELLDLLLYLSYSLGMIGYPSLSMVKLARAYTYAKKLDRYKSYCNNSYFIC
jgi:hypothetical protein